MPYKDKLTRKEYLKDWRIKNNELIKNYRKTEKWKVWNKKYRKGPMATAYRKKYNENISLGVRERRIQERNDTLTAMGGKCSRCGFTDYRAIQIDHINGDGKSERGLLSRRGYYQSVLESFTRNEGRYQLLCCNCNWIKRVENKEYRKKL